MKQELLRIEDLCAKSYKGLKLSHINFSLFRGETISFMETDGSGVQVLTDILCGNLSDISGKIYINEKLISILNEDISSRNGIYKISQGNGLIDELSIAENIFVVRSNSLKKLFVQKKLIYFQTEEILRSIGLNYSPSTKASKLSAAEKHLVELAKAISIGAKIIIFEKIFYLYTSIELERIKSVLSNYKNNGISFIVCCTYLEEARLLSEKIVFFRDGQISKKVKTSELGNDSINDYIISYPLNQIEKQCSNVSSKIVFEAVGITLNDFESPLDLQVKQGEILAIQMVDTAEKDKLFRLLSGREKQAGMSLYLKERKIWYKNAQDILKEKIVSIRGTGFEEELLLNLSIEENLLLPSIKRASGSFGFVNNELIRLLSSTIKSKLLEGKSTSELDRNGKITLLLEKWYIYHPSVVIMLDPFLMSDIIGEDLIFGFIDRISREGTAVIIMASRIHGLEDKCDRFLIMQDGHLSFKGKSISQL